MLLKSVLLFTVTVLLVSSATAQMLSLDQCLQIFAADSLAPPDLRIQKDFSTENLQPTTGLFVKQYRSKTDTRVSMMKVINTDTSRKQLVCNFRSNEQYQKLKEDLQSGKFQHSESNKRLIEGKPNI